MDRPAQDSPVWSMSPASARVSNRAWNERMRDSCLVGNRLAGSSSACGRSAVGSASPCQGEGRGFESRRPLDAGSHHCDGMPCSVGWPRGEATACKAVYTGSNPVPTSTLLFHHGPVPGGPARAISSAGERFPDTEEVTGSIPVSPTIFTPCGLPEYDLMAGATDWWRIEQRTPPAQGLRCSIQTFDST
jgi:hypothetical protein